MAGTVYSITYHSVTCARIAFCGESENNLDSITNYPTTRNEWERNLRKQGWSKTIKHGWLCPECRGDYKTEQRALGKYVSPTREEGDED